MPALVCAHTLVRLATLHRQGTKPSRQHGRQHTSSAPGQNRNRNRVAGIRQAIGRPVGELAIERGWLLLVSQPTVGLQLAKFRVTSFLRACNRTRIGNGRVGVFWRVGQHCATFGQESLNERRASRLIQPG